MRGYIATANTAVYNIPVECDDTFISGHYLSNMGEGFPRMKIKPISQQVGTINSTRIYVEIV